MVDVLGYLGRYTIKIGGNRNPITATIWFTNMKSYIFVVVVVKSFLNPLRILIRIPIRIPIERPTCKALLIRYVTLLKCEKYHQNYLHSFKKNNLISFLNKVKATSFWNYIQVAIQSLWITVLMYVLLMKNFYSGQFYTSLCPLS